MVDRPEGYFAIVGQKRVKITNLSLEQYDIGGKIRAIRFAHNGDIVIAKTEKEEHNIYIKKIGATSYEIWIKDHIVGVNLEDHRTNLINTFKGQTTVLNKSFDVKAPMPGLVVDIPVRKNEYVKMGGELLVLEAMKMENKIISKTNGYIKEIYVKKGDVVEKDQILISMKDE